MLGLSCSTPSFLFKFNLFLFESEYIIYINIAIEIKFMLEN